MPLFPALRRLPVPAHRLSGLSWNRSEPSCVRFCGASARSNSRARSMPSPASPGNIAIACSFTWTSGKVGYFEHGSRRALRDRSLPHRVARSSTRPLAKSEAPLASTAVELFTNETEVQVNVVDRVPAPRSSRGSPLGRTTPIDYAGFQVSRNSFFQSEPLFGGSLSGCRGSAAAPGIWRVDLYAGVGLSL